MEEIDKCGNLAEIMWRFQLDFFSIQMAPTKHITLPTFLGHLIFVQQNIL